MNHVLYEAVANRTTLVTDIEKLDQELLRYINRIADATSSSGLSLLTIPIQHPFKDYTALLVCLVDCINCTDCMYGNESERACTETYNYVLVVQECFR